MDHKDLSTPTSTLSFSTTINNMHSSSAQFSPTVLLAASLSMCANYWKNVCAMDSERWVRNNVTKNIKKGAFRAGRPDDYMEKCTNINYIKLYKTLDDR